MQLSVPPRQAKLGIDILIFQGGYRGSRSIPILFSFEYFVRGTACIAATF